MVFSFFKSLKKKIMRHTAYQIDIFCCGLAKEQENSLPGAIFVVAVATSETSILKCKLAADGIIIFCS